MAAGEFAVLGDEVLPSFTATPHQLVALASSATAGGTPLGLTAGREEIGVELIRAAPTRATLLCTDPWLARLLAVRLAAIGVTTVIATDRPPPWEYFVNVVGGQTPLATIRTDHAQGLPAPSVAAPLLVIEDARDVPPETYAPRVAWQTTLHVRAGVTERSRNLVDGSDVLFVSRLPQDAATAVAAAIGLPDAGAAAIAALDEHELLVVAERRYHLVTVMPTPTERRLL